MTFTVEPVDNRALVIVYPFAINRSRSKKLISLAPVKRFPKLEKKLTSYYGNFRTKTLSTYIVNGPMPETAYLAQVVLFKMIPSHCKMAESVNNL